MTWSTYIQCCHWPSLTVQHGLPCLPILAHWCSLLSPKVHPPQEFTMDTCLFCGDELLSDDPMLFVKIDQCCKPNSLHLSLRHHYVSSICPLINCLLCSPVMHESIGQSDFKMYKEHSVLLTSWSPSVWYIWCRMGLQVIVPSDTASTYQQLARWYDCSQDATIQWQSVEGGCFVSLLSKRNVLLIMNKNLEYGQVI